MSLQRPRATDGIHVRMACLGFCSFVVWTACALAVPPAQASAPTDIIRFHTDDFWLNLHHFLYVLGRAEAKFPDSEREGVNEAPVDQEHGLAAVPAGEQKIWRDAVSAYAAGLSKSDAVSSRELVT